MKGSLIFCALIGIVLSTTEQQLWREFKTKFDKTYKSFREEQFRFEIFKTNLEKIERHNAKYEKGQSSYYLGITKFTDLTEDEFQKTLGVLEIPEKLESNENSLFPNVALPASFDWREKGIVNEVKEQKECGACWAFGALGCLEAQYTIKYNKNISLSVQELIDCAGSFAPILHGCRGGQIWPALLYVNYTGIATESDYPYVAKDGQCKKPVTKILNNTMKEYVFLRSNETNIQKALVAVGPIAVSLNGDGIMLYKGGIFDKKPCSIYNLDHVVLLIGYGIEDDMEYWTLKNSWGADWGEDGYIRLLRNVNQCGVAEYTIHPIMNW